MLSTYLLTCLLFILQTRAYTQLKISGLYPSAYWCGQALIDIPLFYIILLLMVGSLFVFHHGVYFFPEKFLAVVSSILQQIYFLLFFSFYCEYVWILNCLSTKVNKNIFTSFFFKIENHVIS